MSVQTFSTKTVKLSGKHQLTLPVKFLDVLDWGHGDYLELLLDKSSESIVIKATPDPIKELRGILKGTNFSTEKFIQEKKAEEKAREEKFNRLIGND